MGHRKHWRLSESIVDRPLYVILTRSYMTKPNRTGSNTPPRGKEKGITINENATASKNKASTLSTTRVKGKGKENIVELSDASSNSIGLNTNDPITYDSDSVGSDEDELMEAQRNEL
uniref:Uncharacterized protein n=1 Tax=Solanum tuberosum TaxID=4113 RepID=M1DJS3_SOLTU